MTDPISESFKEYMDLLGVSIRELADAMGVSYQTIKQARLSPDAKGFREPPPGWEEALFKIAYRKHQRAEDVLARLHIEVTTGIVGEVRKRLREQEIEAAYDPESDEFEVKVVDVPEPDQRPNRTTLHDHVDDHLDRLRPRPGNPEDG